MTQPPYEPKSGKIRSRHRWMILVAVTVVFAIIAASVLNADNWVESWVSVTFKAMSGACLGWFINRHVDILDLSEVTPEQRPMAAVARAIILGFTILAVATGI